LIEWLSDWVIEWLSRIVFLCSNPDVSAREDLKMGRKAAVFFARKSRVVEVCCSFRKQVLAVKETPRGYFLHVCAIYRTIWNTKTLFFAHKYELLSFESDNRQRAKEGWMVVRTQSLLCPNTNVKRWREAKREVLIQNDRVNISLYE